jgi:hypothetical protein
MGVVAKSYIRKGFLIYKKSMNLQALRYTAKTKCRKFETNIPRKGISGPQSQFPHSCVCARIIYSHDGLPFLLEEICGCGPILGIFIPRKGIYKRNCRCSVCDNLSEGAPQSCYYSVPPSHLLDSSISFSEGTSEPF